MEVVRNSGNADQESNPSGVVSARPEQGRRAAARPERARVLAPPVDVFEGPEAILVIADLPGVASEDLIVRLEKNELVVQGRRHDLAEPVEYRRVFAVPADVDGEGIAADLSRGVLKLTLPRKASAMPRQIPVRGA